MSEKKAPQAIVYSTEPGRAPSSWNEESNVLHRDIRSMPPMGRGAGKYLFEPDTGRAIFDATSGAAVAILGNTMPERVKEARNRVENEVNYISSASYTHNATEKYATWLVGTTGEKMKKVGLYNSGSDAVEAAMKLATQYQRIDKPNPEPERTYYIGRLQSYHGNTFATLALGHYRSRREIYEHAFSDKFHHVPACNEYRQRQDGQSIEEFNAWHANQLEDKILEIGANKVIGFFAEPVVGAALGAMLAPKGYFKAIKKVLDKYGILLIFDEVMCGMGRTGTIHAWQHEDVDVVPDIQVVGKGLGGGEVISAMLVGEKVSNALKNNTGIFVHGYTYQNTPKIAAAAHEVWKMIEDEGFMENARKMGKLLELKLKAVLTDLPFVGNIRGRGLFWGIEFVRDKSTKKSFPSSAGITGRIVELAKSDPYRIHLYPSTGVGADGIDGDAIIISPPFIINEDDVDFIVNTTAWVIKDFFRH